MSDEDRRHIEELLQAYRRRLRPLEIRKAQMGLNSPPEVLNEIDDIRHEIAHLEGELDRVTPEMNSSNVTELRYQAGKAYFKRDWIQAVYFLKQAVMYNPNDEDMQSKLNYASRQLRFQEDYRMICELRKEGLWQAVLDALDDLHRRYPDYADTERLRVWAEERRDLEAVTHQFERVESEAIVAYADNTVFDIIVEPPTLIPETLVEREGANYHVLWVDDNPSNCVFEIDILEQIGIHFTFSPTTEDALTKIATNNYGVIVSDMARPPDRKAGYTLLEELQRRKIAIPFILYSSSDRPEYKAEAKRRGAFASTAGSAELLQLVKAALQIAD